MNHDPMAWTKLGEAIRNDRERQSLTREELVARVIERGGRITARSIANLEAGVVPKKRAKPPTLEPTVAALGWRRDAADRILGGEDSRIVLADSEHPVGADARAEVLELLTAVYEFSRGAVAAGADQNLRNQFDQLAQDLIASIPAGSVASARTGYGLAAYRPHAMGEGIPEDDARRIHDAMENGG